MFTDVYNRGKHFKPFTSSLFRFVTGFGNKAHFYVCLTVLGTSKTTYKALYFLQYYVLKFKLSKATFGPRSARLRGWQFRNVSFILRLYQEAKHGGFARIYRECKSCLGTARKLQKG